MKKMLLVLLSVLLVFSSCWCAFSASAEDAYFETLSNWSWLSYTSKTLDSTAEGYKAPASWQKLKTTSAAGRTNGSTTAIEVNGHVWATIALPNVEKNTTYRITYDYKSISPISTSTKSIIGATGVLAPEVAGNALSWKSTDTTGWLVKNTSKQLAADEATTYGTEDVNTDKGWYTNTFTFDSGNNTNLLLAMYIAFGGTDTKNMKVYLDNIKLESLGATPPMIGNPNEASGWQVYNFDDANNKPLNECTPADSSSSAKITDNTTQVGDYTGSSLMVAANSHWSVANFAVEKNTEYLISFDYYSDTLGSDASGSYALSSVGVVKSGGQIGKTSDDNLAYSSQNTSYKGPYSSREDNTNSVLTTVTGQWQQMSLEFNSLDNEYVGLYFAAAVNPVYIKNVSLIKFVPDDGPIVDYFEDLENWGMYTKNQTVDGTVTVDKVSWQTATINTDAKYCKDSDKSLKIYSNGTMYMTKLQNLKANTKYKVTLDYCVPANATKTTSSTPNSWFSGQIYKHNTTANINTAYVTKQAGDGDTSTEDQWFEYTLEFETDDTTDFYLSLAPRSGGKPYQRYFDNIKIEEVVDITAYDFEDLENWGMYTKNQTVDGTVTADKVSWQTATINTDAKYCKDSDKSLKIYSNGTMYMTKLQNLKANTKYKVTLDYCVPANATKTTSSTPNSWFSGQIYKHNTTANINTAYVTKQAGDGDTSTEDQWFEYTLEFETDDTTDFYLSLAPRSGGKPYQRYFDNIKIEEVTGGETPTPPPVQPSGDVNDASAWKFYPTRFDGNGDYVIGEHLDYVHTWANVTDDTSKVREGTSKSLKFSANSQRAVSTLKVEKNKDYTLKFYYYSDTIGASGYIFSQVQVLKKNGQIGTKSEDNLTIVAGSQSFTGPASNKVTNIDRTATNMKGMWIEFATGFNSGDNEEVSLALFFAAANVYVNDITLVEGKHTPSGPDMYYGEAEEVKIINFEDPSNEYITSQSDRFEVISVKNENGEDTNVLHVKKGIYSSATNLDQAKATTSTHPVYTLPIKSNKVYKLSFKIKIDYSDLEFDAKDKWLSYGIYAEGSFTSFGNVSNKLENNKWYTFTHFVSPSSENCKAFTFFFNAGKPTPDMWIDDITLTETEHERFKGHERGADSWTIDFDSYYVGLTMAERMEVAVGPERDGVASKALHVFKGDYTSATTLNMGSATKNNDPVFTFPVEENTLYKWSAWFNVRKDTGSLSYFAFWHNFHGSGTDARGLWRGDTQIKDRDKWVKYEVTFITDPGQTMCSTTFNLGSTHPEIWIDDLKVEKVPSGTSSSTDLLYCENLYDISDDIDNAADLDNLKSGVYKLPVNKNTEHTFAATITSGKAGDSLQLSFDGTTPMQQSADAPASSLTFSSGNRDGFNFITDRSGYVYIIVNNTSGTLKAEDIQLFARRARSTKREMGKLDNPNVISVKPSIEELETK